MKIVKIKSEKMGLSPEKAQEIWDAFEKFGGYGFNKSHSVAYATISYQSMYMKSHHTAAFFAAALSILGEDKHQAIVKDAMQYGVVVMPPDINISSDRIELAPLPDGRTALYAPFSAVKGCSDNGCRAIVVARAKVGGKFESIEQFELAVEKRACNARVRDGLRKVGAFASIEPGEPPADDESRKRDQAELMGSLFTGAVKISRNFDMNPRKQSEIAKLMEDLRAESGLGEELVTPYIGIKPRVMIILNNANGNDAKSKIFMNYGYEDFRSLLGEHGDLRMGDLYVTGVFKRRKEESNPYKKAEEDLFVDYMKREIELVQPTYVVACGAAASRLFNEKDKIGDLTGRKEFFPDKDMTVFHAFTPGILHFRPEEGEKLELIFEELKEALK